MRNLTLDHLLLKLVTNVSVSSAPVVSKLLMGSAGVTKFGLHPTPEGPFREGNDLSAVRCKSILRSTVAQSICIFHIWARTDQGASRRS